MTTPQQSSPPARPPTSVSPRISIELTNVCNLKCSYCVRDEDALHHSPATFFPVDLLRRIIVRAKETYGITCVSFTGGEVTVHPKFGEIVEAVAEEGLQYTFVTNGWHFERVYPILIKHRAALNLVAFSLDGPTREEHDHWRGVGSFVRVVRAMTHCWTSGIPFILKVGIRRDTVSRLQEFALFGARLGASGIHFAHLLPTSVAAEDAWALTREERRDAEYEIGILSNIFKIPVGVVTGYYDIDPAPPCPALSGRTCNVDYRGRLSLCCNLSGYRGAAGEAEVVADLNSEDFAEGFARLERVAEEQNGRRTRALASFAERGEQPDLYTGSPCLFCLHSFGKIPWRDNDKYARARRALPVIRTGPATAT